MLCSRGEAVESGGMYEVKYLRAALLRSNRLFCSPRRCSQKLFGWAEPRQSLPRTSAVDG